MNRYSDGYYNDSYYEPDDEDFDEDEELNEDDESEQDDE